MSESTGPTRRGVLLTLGIALNAVAATLLAIPLVGFVLSPARRWSWQQWISLGPLADFPENQTRLATYRNPFSRPWDGETANIPCWVRQDLGRRVPGFRHQLHASRLPRALVPGRRACSCARVTAASTTPTASTRRGRRRVRSTSTITRSRTASSGCAADRFPRCRNRCDGLSPDHRRLARSASRTRRADRGGGDPPRPARHRELVVRVRQRHAGVLRGAGRDRHLPRDRVRPLGRRRLAEPRGAQLRAAPRLVPARGARLGLELHGRADERAPDPGVPLRRLQVPARADVDRRRDPVPLYARHGVHRTGAALRPGRVLGARHRRRDRRPRAVHRTGGGAPDARRSDHRRRNAVALLHAPRLRDPRSADRVRGLAPVPRPEARHQRVADARTPGEPRDLPPRLRGPRRARRRAVLPRRREAGPGRRGGDDRGDPGVRGALRAVRSERRTRPDHHPDHAAAGLLLPVAVLRLRAASAVHRDRPDADGARHRHPARSSPSRSSRAPARRAGSAARWRSSG